MRSRLLFKLAYVTVSARRPPALPPRLAWPPTAPHLFQDPVGLHQGLGVDALQHLGVVLLPVRNVVAPDGVAVVALDLLPSGQEEE